MHGKVPVIKIKSLNLFVSMPKDRPKGWLEQILFCENLECSQNLMFLFNNYKPIGFSNELKYEIDTGHLFVQKVTSSSNAK